MKNLILGVLLIFLQSLPLFAETPIRIGIAGDIMMHNTQLSRAWLGLNASGEDRGYDFNPAFEWFTPYLKDPDLMIGNLETTFGGPNSALVTNETYAFREYQAYPTFTTPDQLAPALKNAGFDVLVTANNHCMDSNLEGVTRTLDVLDNAELAYTGTARGNRSEAWRGRVGGLNISLLSWTASVNGLISSRGMDGINVYSSRGKNARLQEMLTDIRREADLKPDLLMLYIHWGQEYREEPNNDQKDIADLVINAGVDVIIGSHPHFFQPIERRIVEGPQGLKEVFIIWSMGNFISSQKYREGEREWTDGSAMLVLEISRGKRQPARVASAEAIPLYVAWTDEQIQVISVAEGLVEGAAETLGLNQYDLARLDAFDRWIPGQFTRYLGELPALKTTSGWKVDFAEP